VVSQGDSALELLSKKRNYFDVVIMDYQIVGSITGERLIKKIKEIDNTIQIIVITKMTVNITDFDFIIFQLGARFSMENFLDFSISRVSGLFMGMVTKMWIRHRSRWQA